MNMNMYKKSNQTENVSLKRFSKEKYVQMLSAGESNIIRTDYSQKLLDYLCGKFKIPNVKIQVINKCQPHNERNGKLQSKTYGKYKIHSKEIVIYNLTVVRKNIVSINVFADTLLHEFMHHYDIEYLKMDKSLHTAGFYKRISDLKEKLSKS